MRVQRPLVCHTEHTCVTHLLWIVLQESPIGYDNVGVVRYLVLSLVAAGAVGALAVKGAITLLPERVAKRIDFHKDVLRIY